MHIAVAKPVALERMIALARFKFCIFRQQQDHCLELGHVLAAFLRPLDVLFERRRADNLPQGSDAEIVEQRFGTLEALALASIQFCHRRLAFRIGHSHIKRQPFFRSNPVQHHTDRIGDRQTHRRQRLRGGQFRVAVYPRANRVIGEYWNILCCHNVATISQCVDAGQN